MLNSPITDCHFDSQSCKHGRFGPLIKQEKFHAVARFSADYKLETLNMQLHFAIGESHLTLSEVSMREQGQRRSQTRIERRRPQLAQD